MFLQSPLYRNKGVVLADLTMGWALDHTPVRSIFHSLVTEVRPSAFHIRATILPGVRHNFGSRRGFIEDVAATWGCAWWESTPIELEYMRTSAQNVDIT